LGVEFEPQNTTVQLREVVLLDPPDTFIAGEWFVLKPIDSGQRTRVLLRSRGGWLEPVARKLPQRLSLSWPLAALIDRGPGELLHHYSIAQHDRTSAGHWLGEVIATLGLLLVIFALARSRRAHVTPAAVGAYIGAAYFFPSSTSFANPAITVGRMFSNTFAGIAPGSVPGFVAAQLVGAVAAFGLSGLLYPDVRAAADNVVVPADELVASAE
jgi:hypothetical protein